MLSLPLAPTNGDPLTVLCLGSHADDIEIGCGGTILKLVSSRTKASVHWIVFGATGIREEEARLSAERFLGAAAKRCVVTHHFRDGYFPFQGAQIKEVFEEIKGRVSPDVIFTHAMSDRHQDHRLLADLTWNTFRNHLILEYEIPKYDGDLGAPNTFVALDTETCDMKVRSIIEAFPSQHDKHWFSEQTFYALMRLRGMECAAPEHFAEAFYCRKNLLRF